MVLLSDRIAKRLKLLPAIQAELLEPSSLLPSRTIEDSFRGQGEALVGLIEGWIKSGTRPAATEVVAAAKSSRGFRPVHVLDFETRVVLRALVDLLAPDIAYPDRSDEAYEAFKRAPLLDESASHVVRADVASFYQYIDHELLRAEVVRQTGEADASMSIGQLLREVMGRSFGLPQNTGASHALADAYIDNVERQLIRRGHAVWRYNDDFALKTWSDRSALLD
jgi:hypothetical protein